ncbi:MAG: RNA methyltransferase [Clostridiales bacterium]|nr:MAG: RNA methyltransferase [Clostridiales bacterium]
MKEKIILEGSISVKAAIEGKNRKIFSVFADKNKKDKDIAYILRIAERDGAKICRTDREKISQMTNGSSHGGVCAEVSQRSFVTPEELLNDENPFIILLEGIEDPYNFGDCIRSAYAAGATGLLIPERNWMSADAVVARASAGASERIKTTAAKDFLPIIYAAKQKGVNLVIAERKDAVSLHDTTLKKPLMLAIGGRLRGLSKPIFDAADLRVYIPYNNDFKNSLSASAACSVMSFAVQ